MPTRPRITGPVAGGSHGWPFGAPDRAEIEARGYVMEEFFLEGTARRYRAKPGTTPGIDGRWETEVSETAPYKTIQVTPIPTTSMRKALGCCGTDPAAANRTKTIPIFIGDASNICNCLHAIYSEPRFWSAGLTYEF